jgi:hypothetical protein
MLQRTLQYLKEHPELRVIATDKNLGLALVTTSFYDEMCRQHLKDVKTYQYVGTVHRFQVSLQTKNSLADLNYMACKIWSGIKSLDRFLDVDTTTPKIPHFHCIAKIHKTPVAGRPIAGAHSWITTPISKLLSYALRQLMDPLTHLLRDSKDLVDTCEGMKLGNTDMLVTMDVTALYPSMDHLETIKSLDILTFPSQAMKTWCKDATRFVLKNSFVQYDNGTYRQVSGTAMGTNCAVELANIYVTKFIELSPQMDRWRPHIRLWKRFIDDIFMIFTGSQQQLGAFLHWINNIHPSLRFTIKASRKSIDFLDVDIYRSPANTLQFKVFQKSLNRYLYLPIHSNHPWHCKTGFIKGELLRYARLSSTEKHFVEMKSLFFIRLQQRGYPASLLISKFREVQHASRLDGRHKSRQSKLLNLYEDIFGKTDETFEKQNRVMMTVTYHPTIRKLRLAHKLRQHWHLLRIHQSHSPMQVFRKAKNHASIFTSSAFSKTSSVGKAVKEGVRGNVAFANKKRKMLHASSFPRNIHSHPL